MIETIVTKESEQLQYPIAEIFKSIQGEGYWAGTVMTFVRFAGCTVGKPYTPAAREALGLQVYQERCCDWAGNSFTCDTNYRLSKRMTVEEIVAEVGDAEHVCFTGGEPLMHDIEMLHKCLMLATNTDSSKRARQIHIETSGTISCDWLSEVAWVTVSPKLGCLQRVLDQADEIKILVGHFDEARFVQTYRQYFDRIWIQPVNQEHEIDQLNLQRCVQLVMKYPQLRLSTQLHKIWKVR